MRTLLASFLVLVSLAASGAERRRAIRGPIFGTPIVIHDDFRGGDRGWQGAFADYSPVNGFMELEAGIRPLPPELSVNGTGYYMTGHNRSDDLFMFLTKKLTAANGIEPGQRYEVSFDLLFASQAGGENCGGIGGAPGFSVYLKAGASSQEPRVYLDDMNHFRVAIDKGNQSQGGSDMSVAGTIQNGSDDCRSEAPFISLRREHRHTSFVTANSAGELWLIVGTDSGFEGRTQIYYQVISATLTPVN